VKLLKYFLLYELAAFLVNKSSGSQKLPFDLISALMPQSTAVPAQQTLAAQTPVGRVTLTTPLITPGGGISS
jgi:hypothetical protein